MLELAFFDGAGSPVRAGALLAAEENQSEGSIGLRKERYRLRIAADEGPLRIEVLDESGSLGARYEGRVEAALPELRLTLVELPTLGVRVQDSNGEPVPGADVKFHRLDSDRQRDPVNALWLRHDDFLNGLLESIEQGPEAPASSSLHERHVFNGPFELEVTAPGFSTLALRPFGRVSAAPIEATLQRLPRVTGRVLTGGDPIAGASVTLHAAPLTRQEFAGGVPLAFLQKPIAETTTDGEGRFELPAPRAQRLVALARAQGLGEQWVVLEEPTADLELRLALPGRVEGRLLPAPGNAGTRLEGRHVALARGGLDARSVEVDAEGHFAFEGVSSGEWTVAPIATPLQLPLDPDTSVGGTNRKQLAPNLTVRSGATARIDLELFAPGRLRIHGQVTIDGQPAAGWRAEANTSPNWPTPEWSGPGHVLLEADGRFTVEAPRGIAFSLVLSGVSVELPLEVRRSLPRQNSDDLWLESLDLVTGAIEGTASDQQASLRIEGELAYDWSWNAWVGLRENDPFLYRGAPAGDLRFGSGYEPAGTGLTPLRLEPGETARAQLP